MNIVEAIDLRLEDNRYNARIMGNDQRFLKTLLSDWGETTLDIDYLERVKMISMFIVIDRTIISHIDLSNYMNRYVQYVNTHKDREDTDVDILFLYTVYRIGMNLGIRQIDEKSQEYMRNHGDMNCSVIMDGVMNSMESDVLETIGYNASFSNDETTVTHVIHDGVDMMFIETGVYSKLYGPDGGEVNDDYVMNILENSDDVMEEMYTDDELDVFENGYVFDDKSTVVDMIFDVFSSTIFNVESLSGDLLVGLFVYVYGVKHAMRLMMETMYNYTLSIIYVMDGDKLFKGDSELGRAMLLDYIVRAKIVNDLAERCITAQQDSFLKKDYNKYIGEW